VTRQTPLISPKAFLRKSRASVRSPALLERKRRIENRFIKMGFSVLLNPENRETGRKLGIATGLMFTLPFIAFYIAMVVFADKKNPENWAGAAAIIATNLVVGGYCYVAYIEDMDKNDEDGPRTGAAKQRVD